MNNQCGYCDFVPGVVDAYFYRVHHGNALIVRTLRQGRRERASIVALIIAIALAMWYPYALMAVYVGVVIMWVLPDRELEEALSD